MLSLEYKKTNRSTKIIIFILTFLILFNISFGSYLRGVYADFVVTPAVIAWAVAAVASGVVFANNLILL